MRWSVCCLREWVWCGAYVRSCFCVRACVFVCRLSVCPHSLRAKVVYLLPSGMPLAAWYVCMWPQSSLSGTQRIVQQTPDDDSSATSPLQILRSTVLITHHSSRIVQNQKIRQDNGGGWDFSARFSRQLKERGKAEEHASDRRGWAGGGGYAQREAPTDWPLRKETAAISGGLFDSGSCLLEKRVKMLQGHNKTRRMGEEQQGPGLQTTKVTLAGLLSQRHQGTNREPNHFQKIQPTSFEHHCTKLVFP